MQSATARRQVAIPRFPGRTPCWQSSWRLHVRTCQLGRQPTSQQRPVASKLKQANIPFNGQRAYGYLKDLCAIGPRVSGTEGMQRQQAYLKDHFEQLGGRVTLQGFMLAIR